MLQKGVILLLLSSDDKTKSIQGQWVNGCVLIKGLSIAVTQEAKGSRNPGRKGTKKNLTKIVFFMSVTFSPTPIALNVSLYYSHFHLAAHVNYLLKFYSTPQSILYFLQQPQKKIDMISTPSHCMAIVVVAVVTVLFNNLREKRSVPPTTQSGTTCKNFCRAPVENRALLQKYQRQKDRKPNVTSHWSLTHREAAFVFTKGRRS